MPDDEAIPVPAPSILPAPFVRRPRDYEDARQRERDLIAAAIKLIRAEMRELRKARR